MLNRKILIVGISVAMFGITTSPKTLAQSNSSVSDQAYLMTQPSFIYHMLTTETPKHHKSNSSAKKSTRSSRASRHKASRTTRHKATRHRASRYKASRATRHKATRHRATRTLASNSLPKTSARPHTTTHKFAQLNSNVKKISQGRRRAIRSNSAARTSTQSNKPKPQQAYVAARLLPEPREITAKTSMQPSTSHTKPPKRISSALGLGPNSRIHINGFLSAGGAHSNTIADYLVPGHGIIDNHFNYAANSLIGLQFAADLAKNMQVVTQFVANGDDTNGNTAYRVNAEWAYLRYSMGRSFQVRTGRFRIPAFLYSETEQVGYSYPFLQLPNEVYRLVPFNNLNGANFIYRYSLGNSGWIITFEPFYGANTSSFTIYNVAFPTGLTVNFREQDIKGAVAMIGNPNFILRGTYADLKLVGDIRGGPAFLPTSKTEYYSVSIKWTPGHILLLGEYAGRNTPSQIASLVGYYGTIGYRIGKITPIFTYARLRTRKASALAAAPFISERPQDQESYTLGFDYTINSNLDAKASISKVTPLNGNFGLFTINPERKHITIYGVSLDAIF